MFGSDAASQGGSVDAASRFCKLVEVLKPAVAGVFPEHVDYGTQCGALCRSTDPALPADQEQLLQMQHNARVVWNELVRRAKKTQRARGAPDLLLVSTVHGRHHFHIVSECIGRLGRQEPSQRYDVHHVVGGP